MGKDILKQPLQPGNCLVESNLLVVEIAAE